MGIDVIRFSERPELWESTDSVSAQVWPEYNLHGDRLSRYWARLFDEFPGFQYVLYDDEGNDVLAEGHTLPCCWDGTADGLGDGIDAMVADAFAGYDAGRPAGNRTVRARGGDPATFQGRGLADRMLGVMVGLARDAALRHLIAPVRPSIKDRYPPTSIERYVAWTREDGQPFDPWIRIHSRRGGVISRPVPRSMRITGTVADWEQWTQMRFPDDGQYVFPAGLAPVEIDHERDRGTYWEPNVWIVHTVETDSEGLASQAL